MDALIASRYSELLQQAERGELQAWERSPRACLALILVLDQFSRHVYRHSDRKHIDDNDARALPIAKAYLERWGRWHCGRLRTNILLDCLSLSAPHAHARTHLFRFAL